MVHPAKDVCAFVCVCANDDVADDADDDEQAQWPETSS